MEDPELLGETSLLHLRRKSLDNKMEDPELSGATFSRNYGNKQGKYTDFMAKLVVLNILSVLVRAYSAHTVRILLG